MRRTSSHAWRRADGSNPVVGSSRNKQVGIADEPEREIEPALLAARQCADATRRLLVEIDQLDDLVDRTRRRVEARVHREHLAHGEVRIEAALTATRCRCASGSRRHRVAGSKPSDAHLAAVAVAVALEDLDRRGLARAVRTEHGHHFALVDAEAEIAHGVDAPYDLRSPRTSIAFTPTFCIGRPPERAGLPRPT